jgi:hypothetical protein
MFFSKNKFYKFVKKDAPKDEIVNNPIQEEKEIRPMFPQRATLNGNSIIERQRNVIIKHVFETEELAKAFYDDNFADAI